MQKLKEIRISQLGFAVVCALAVAFIATESKRLGNTQKTLILSACGGIAPYVIKIIEDKIKERNQKLKDDLKALNESIYQLRLEIKNIQKEIDSRLDEVESKIPIIQDIVQTNRESVNSAFNAIEQLKGEIYSARGESQNAGKIAELALKMAQDAQDRINYVLSSGSIIRLTEKTTAHDLKIAIIERKIKKNF